MNFLLRFCIASLLFLFFEKNVEAQSNPTKEYLDYYFFKCPKASAKFYRLATYDADSVYQGNIKTYFISGKIYSDINYNHGIKEGLWTWWFENGQKSEEAFFDYNSGYTKNSWTSEGQPMVVNGSGMDTYRYWIIGKIYSKGKYEKGVREGVWEWYHENGRLKERAQMVNGGEVLLELFYDEDGKELVKNGNGVAKDYHKKGVLEWIGNYKNGKREGLWLFYHKDGKLSDSCYYVNGKLHGHYLEWFQNGRKKFEADYVEGEMDGKVIWWHWNGKIKESREYKSGEYTITNTWSQQGTPMVSDGKGYNETSYYNDILESRGFYENGKPNGTWVWYYPTGSINQEGEYTKEGFLIKNYYAMDGKKTVTNGTGEMIDYYKSNGSMDTKGNYLNGKKNGSWTYYYENGNAQAKANYLEDKKNGTWTFYHQNGKVKEIATYLTDSLVGNNITYYDNGVEEYEKIEKGDTTYSNSWFDDGKIEKQAYQVKGGMWHIITFSNKEGKIMVNQGNGNCETFYASGQLESRGSYKNYLENGTWERWYENGAPEYVSEYIDGIQNGSYKEYNNEGTLIFEGVFKNGEKDGLCKWYHSNKQLDSKAYYVNGQLTGQSSNYSDEGTLLFEGNYQNGEKHGLCKWYHKNGQPESTTNYINGYANGLNQTYNEQGQRIFEGIYKNNLKDGLCKWYYDDGSLRKTCNYTDDLLNGLYTEYNEVGKISFVGTFKEDHKDGTCKWYYDDGTLKLIENYKKGELDGVSIKYSEDGKVAWKKKYKNGERQ